jgi:hypothetical protein
MLCSKDGEFLIRDNRPKLFRKTNISNDVAGALHPIVGRSGPDTVELFTFLTLSDFQSVAKWFAHRIVFAGQGSRSASVSSRQRGQRSCSAIGNFSRRIPGIQGIRHADRAVMSLSCA